jgi:hypothetical protein
MEKAPSKGKATDDMTLKMLITKGGIVTQAMLMGYNCIIACNLNSSTALCTASSGCMPSTLVSSAAESCCKKQSHVAMMIGVSYRHIEIVSVLLHSLIEGFLQLPKASTMILQI